MEGPKILITPFDMTLRWGLLLLLALGRSDCPSNDKADFDSCQTDILLGGSLRDDTPKTVAPTQQPGRSSAACVDWPGCAPLGLFGDCCPSNGGAMLGCCSAPGRRLALLQMERKGVTIDDTTLQS
ncbi:unnamed protein product [Symbiodinium sp. CCMP2592]|nr:unnamed protein product [Symbiodinium sp. CCMP2592]